MSSNSEAVNLTEETPAPVKEAHPLDEAAHHFKTAVTIIKNKTGTMPRKSLERVFDAIVEFPLGEENPKFRNKAENDLFMLTLTAMTAKNQMINAVMNGISATESKLNEAQSAVDGE